jgi:hypothetical protein
MSDAEPIATVRDYAGLVDALRGLKAHLGLSNALVDELCGWTNGHCDKLLGPSGVRAFSPKTFNDLTWVLAAKVTVTIDPERLLEMAQHWEKRCSAHTREQPNRISKRIIATAQPHVMRKLGQIGGQVTFHKMSDAERSALGRKAARARWRKPRRTKAG